ncbi:uncharacterized protein LOC135329514 [Dromaius novaehollandiae]|uniref:uncharacterized protein LOC135329514 n=1 Tax=Dromaius novaehollandiae TaxID=8790 RepID=UPI00311FEE64
MKFSKYLMVTDERAVPVCPPAARSPSWQRAALPNVQLQITRRCAADTTSGNGTVIDSHRVWERHEHIDMQTNKKMNKGDEKDIHFCMTKRQRSGLSSGASAARGCRRPPNPISLLPPWSCPTGPGTPARSLLPGLAPRGRAAGGAEQRCVLFPWQHVPCCGSASRRSARQPGPALAPPSITPEPSACSQTKRAGGSMFGKQSLFMNKASSSSLHLRDFFKNTKQPEEEQPSSEPRGKGRCRGQRKPRLGFFCPCSLHLASFLKEGAGATQGW